MRFLLFLLIGTLLSACAPEMQAAMLLHGVVTTPEWERDYTTFGVRKLKCGGATLKLDSGVAQGNHEFTSKGRAVYLWYVKLYLPLPPGELDPERHTLECRAELESSLDDTKVSSFRLSGPVHLKSCDYFSCTLKNMPVDCEKLKKALETACQ